MNSSGGSKVVQFKLVLLGDSAVGKSSLVLRFVRGQFFEYQESTIGAAFLTQVTPVDRPKHPLLTLSCHPAECLAERLHSQIRDMGHRRPGALSQLSPGPTQLFCRLIC